LCKLGALADPAESVGSAETIDVCVTITILPFGSVDVSVATTNLELRVTVWP